jgi:hypothetical protein
MFIRSKLASEKTTGTFFAVGLIVVAAIALLYQFWPHKKADLSMAYYTDDDGATFFEDSSFKIAPFDHNGKTAYIAEVYTYDDGSKKFCAYLAKYTPEAKKRLEAAIADAQAKGQPPGSVSLFNDRNFVNSGMMVKLPGADKQWLAFTDPRASAVFSIHSPDGSAVDEAFVY